MSSINLRDGEQGSAPQKSKDLLLSEIYNFALSDQIAASKEEANALLKDVENIFDKAVVEFINLNPRKNNGTGRGGSIHVYYRSPFKIFHDKNFYYEHHVYSLAGRFNGATKRKELRGYHLTYPLSIAAQAEVANLLIKHKVYTSDKPMIYVYNYKDHSAVYGSSRYDFNKSYSELIIGRPTTVKPGSIFVVKDELDRIIFGIIGEKTIDSQHEWNYASINKVEKWLTGIATLPKEFDKDCFIPSFEHTYQKRLFLILNYIKSGKDLAEIADMPKSSNVVTPIAYQNEIKDMLIKHIKSVDASVVLRCRNRKNGTILIKSIFVSKHNILECKIKEDGNIHIKIFSDALNKNMPGYVFNKSGWARIQYRGRKKIEFSLKELEELLPGIINDLQKSANNSFLGTHSDSVIREKNLYDVISFLNENEIIFNRKDNKRNITWFEFLYKRRKLKIYITSGGKIGIAGILKYHKEHSAVYYASNGQYKLKGNPLAHSLEEFKNIYNNFIEHL